MTTYLDYKVLPAENNGPPPVGAPENMPTSQVNNVMREIMSVIRQLGDSAMAAIEDLGSMANQNADAVAITGGTVAATLSGPGGGITNLKAQNLIEGPIPAAIFPADATPLNIKVARAGSADSLTSSLAILPIGSIIMWYSANPIPAGWRICDGGGGTPNLVGRFAIGAGGGWALGQQGGQYSYNSVSDAQGVHSHGGGTGNTTLTTAQMPSHWHAERSGWTSGNPQANTGQIYSGATYGFWIIPPNLVTDPAGGDQPHNHGIGADGSHAHNVNVNSTPPYTAVFYIMRVS